MRSSNLLDWLIDVHLAAKLYNTGPLQKRKIRGNTVHGPAVARINKSSATAVCGPAFTNSSTKQVAPWSAVFQSTRVRKHVPPRSAVTVTRVGVVVIWDI